MVWFESKRKGLKQLYVWNKGVYLCICFDQRVVRTEESDFIALGKDRGFRDCRVFKK